MDAAAVEALLQSHGLTKKFKSQNAQNKAAIVELLGKVDSSVLTKTRAESLVDVAVKLPENPEGKAFLTEYILADKLPARQLVLAFNYFKGKSGVVDKEDFEKACGVGVVVSSEEIIAALKEILATFASEFEGKNPTQQKSIMWKVLGQNRDKYLNFADDSVVRVELDKLLSAPPPPKTTRSEDTLLSEDVFPPPEKNTVNNSPEVLAQHLKETGGKFLLRFPPEPNGYLHIGHAKSMNLNFGYAKKFNGHCYMRFDDTNPETESQEYIDSILDTVQWMGHKWWKITYASDYFDRLYECAIELIKRGKAYVCHQTPEEIEECRKTHTDSPYRNRTVEENLQLFDDMKNGKFEEGKATLRMKMDMKSGNSCMWDLVAYRVKKTPHHRTGDKWVIYPSYDFTHCLCDTFENITHSLCTLEFRMRRESYEWLVKALGLYVSYVFEFSRLNLTCTVLSKRKLIQLVHGNHVNGWDDPRLPTVTGLRRRGYSPQGINNFCADIGVTTNVSTIPIEKLEHFVRLDLNATSRRIFAVLDPIKVTIKNGTGGLTEVKCPNVPSKAEFGEHTIPFTTSLFIERSDFKLEDVPDYFGLALNNPDKYVKLKNANVNIRLVDVKKNDNGEVVELIAEHCEGKMANSKVHPIHWVPIVEGKEPIKVEVRDYDRLFLSEDPVAKCGKQWLDDLNPHSLHVHSAIIDPSVVDLKPLDRVQFERLGFYCVDLDTDAATGKYVFNKTVGLKESNWKKKGAK